MNDPTNWNVDESIKSIEVSDPATAKEMAKRWNAYPHLVKALLELVDADRDTTLGAERSDWAIALLKDLGAWE